MITGAQDYGVHAADHGALPVPTAAPDRPSVLAKSPITCEVCGQPFAA
jgi:hypothetical protein